MDQLTTIGKERFARFREASRDELLGRRERHAGINRFLRCLPFLVFESVALIVFILESSLLGRSFEAGVLLFHGLASLLFPFALRAWLPASYIENRYLSFFLVFGFACSLPLFGPLCVLVLLGVIKEKRPSQGDVKQAPLIVGSRIPDAADLDFGSGPQTVDSILQIMIGADPLARRNLILATKRLNPEQAIPILRTGLRDCDEETKLYSQAMLSQLVERCERNISELKSRVAQVPDDKDAMFRLAEQYFEIVELDLVTDAELQRFYVIRAIELLENVLSSDCEDDTVLFRLVQYHLRIEQIEEAEGYLDCLRERGVSSELLEPFEVEILYCRRSWTHFRTRIQTTVVNRFCDPSLQKAGEFWMKPGSTSSLGQFARISERLAG